jgi:hypothetical protein
MVSVAAKLISQDLGRNSVIGRWRCGVTRDLRLRLCFADCEAQSSLRMT